MSQFGELENPEIGKLVCDGSPNWVMLHVRGLVDWSLRGADLQGRLRISVILSLCQFCLLIRQVGKKFLPLQNVRCSVRVTDRIFNWNFTYDLWEAGRWTDRFLYEINSYRRLRLLFWDPGNKLLIKVCVQLVVKFIMLLSRRVEVKSIIFYFDCHPAMLQRILHDVFT